MGRSMRACLGAVMAALALPAVLSVHAQQITYKCTGRSGVTYTEVPCAGGKEIGATTRRITDKSVAPPQDRATIARRATLSADDRAECVALDARMREQATQLKSLGTGATLQDEMPLVQSKKRYRELGC
jgi:hypothetical protein